MIRLNAPGITDTDNIFLPRDTHTHTHTPNSYTRDPLELTRSVSYSDPSYPGSVRPFMLAPSQQKASYIPVVVTQTLQRRQGLGSIRSRQRGRGPGMGPGPGGALGGAEYSVPPPSFRLCQLSSPFQKGKPGQPALLPSRLPPRSPPPPTNTLQIPLKRSPWQIPSPKRASDSSQR